MVSRHKNFTLIQTALSTYTTGGLFLKLMHDAHLSELAGAATSSTKQRSNARRVAWVEHRSTSNQNFYLYLLNIAVHNKYIN